MLDFDVL